MIRYAFLSLLLLLMLAPRTHTWAQTARQEGALFGFVNASGQWVLRPQYDYAKDFAHQVALVAQGGKWGIIRPNGSWVADPVYDAIDDFKDGFARVMQGGRYGLMRPNGTLAIPVEHPTLVQYAAKSGMIKLQLGSKYGLLKPDGTWLAEPRYSYISEFDKQGVAELIAQGQSQYITLKGKLYSKTATPPQTVPQQPSYQPSPAPGAAQPQRPMATPAPVEVAGTGSDIDQDIPQGKGVSGRHTYALIIGNEHYKRYSGVTYALADARLFARYCELTLGVPADNITLLTDATYGDMIEGVERLSKLAEYSRGQASLIVYYAGHGLPDPEERNAYIMPVDILDVRNGYKLSDLYAALARYPVQRATVFLDACFSGGSRDGRLMADVRGVTIAPKRGMVHGNVVVFAASTDSQYALPNHQQGHGMFTYYLLKKIQTTAGQVSYGELYDYLRTEVPLNAIKQNHGKDQNPSLLCSPQLDTLWQGFKVGG